MNFSLGTSNCQKNDCRFRKCAYNNPVNIKYTQRKEIKYCRYVEGLVVLARHFRMVLVLLTKIHQISTPFKHLDKGETPATTGACGDCELIHHVLTKAPTSQ